MDLVRSHVLHGHLVEGCGNGCPPDNYESVTSLRKETINTVILHVKYLYALLKTSSVSSLKAASQVFHEITCGRPCGLADRESPRGGNVIIAMMKSTG
jgi:hypothetical protein